MNNRKSTRGRISYNNLVSSIANNNNDLDIQRKNSQLQKAIKMLNKQINEDKPNDKLITYSEKIVNRLNYELERSLNLPSRTLI